MIRVEGDLCIVLINLYKNKSPDIQAVLFDTFVGQRLFLKVIDTCLTQTFNVTYKYKGNTDLYTYKELVRLFFLNINETEPNLQAWLHLLQCFLAHFFILSINDIQQIPALLRVDNRVFIALYNENTFDSSVLSLLKEEDYPEVFNYVTRPTASSKNNPGFSKYLIKKDSSQQLLIPEFPVEFRHQLSRFYTELIEVFHTITLNTEDEHYEAPFVLDYLTKIRDFFEPNLPQ